MHDKPLNCLGKKEKVFTQVHITENNELTHTHNLKYKKQKLIP